ncbi:DNase I-like protein [Delitschia confertaspora ATCC 74209]|uniref:DNase I-like protein n=1 Tax=Delitschia confertaspora ATCC 74209 TaxID=1513339 RepID=A0A9P4JGV7_9PLEO|nr:DNase I-like protein [Delitschia confertaspora ATCC 74209]
MDYSGSPLTPPRGRTPRTAWSNSKPRPTSMVTLSPSASPTKSAPRVMVQSPHSPPKPASPQIHTPTPSRSLPQDVLNSPGPRSDSPVSKGPRHFRIPSRNPTPAVDNKRASFLQSSTGATNMMDTQKTANNQSEFNVKSQPATPGSVPPPINRAGKPKIFNKPRSVEPTNRTSLAPETSNSAAEERVSPFSTPPSSSEGSIRGEMSPPSIPINSRPTMFTASSIDGYFPPPSRSQTFTGNAHSIDARTRGISPPKKLMPSHIHQSNDRPQDRPGLPPRREPTDIRKSMVLSRATPPEPPVRRSMDTFRPSSLDTGPSPKFLPPPKRSQTFASPSPPNQTLQPPPPVRTASRRSGEFRRPVSIHSPVPKNYDSDDTELYDKSTPPLTDYPDSSQANRRPPIFRNGTREIPTKYESKLFAICGEYICTTGYVTRVWSVLTGELLMSLSHGETVKVTAVSFRPAKDVENEGKRLWLGTNIGEIHEVDVPTQSVVQTKANAHPRAQIIKIFRYASEMWSLDDEGKIHIWPPDETGSPTLGQTPNSFRIQKGHTFSILCGNQLWIATGKEIRVFQRTKDNTFFTQPLQRPFSQPNAGEVTAGAILSSQPDRVYFGHTDGKVSIYAKKDFSCLGVVNVSLYKISSLVGVGDYLWAGYITGMIYVYDTTCQPWKVMKDWRAHENAIAGINVDRSSIWKLDRLQVASLGLDNTLRIWDGMLKDDWLESRMHEHDADFCNFRELSVTVMTWNAGASKPTSLNHNDRDRNFFRELLDSNNPSDILVFGFQELVDLEDKKVTARSFFKKGKKKDATDHEHMSHQYRAWRDHLIRVIGENIPNESYTLLHTANLVGLFTCLFVKSSERNNIRDVCASQVKLGMGGLHGNKGALIVRFFIDDSSLCFINCHLAAGQTQTMHRNNDVAAIMEAESLPSNRDANGRSDFFVGGGDGSMILDHEICILNGDLNYRIDAMPRNTVVDAVKANNLSKLLDRDQLLLSRKRNPGFRLRAFREGPITFAPTYKYDVGTDNYDTSEKKRSPAWCDRLLYRGAGRIKQLDYRRHEVRVSDHRPVSGKFMIRVKTIEPKRKNAVSERCEEEFLQVKRRIAMDIK